MTVLAHRRDVELAAGLTVVLARWRDFKSASGLTAVLAHRRDVADGGAYSLVAGATTSRRGRGRHCLLIARSAHSACSVA